MAFRRWRSILAVASLTALAGTVVPIGCSIGADSAPGASATDDSGSGPEQPAQDAADQIIIVLPEPCVMLPAPTGSYCTCTYNCAGTELHCNCAGFCWEDRDDCLIIVQDGTASSSDGFLSTCELQCWWVEAEVMGEFTEPAHMECNVTNCEAPPPIPPPDTGVRDAAPPPAPPPIPPPDDGGTVVPPEDGGTEPPPEDAAPPPPPPICPVPVPGPTTIPGPVWGEYDIPFHVPFPQYAFAVAQTWYLAEMSGIDGFHLVPSFLLATSLKESFMGCNNDLVHWAPGMEGIVYRGANSVDIDGCFQIESTTAYVELDHHFPELNTEAGHLNLVSSTNQDSLGRDNFVSSVVLAAYYDVWVWGMMTSTLYDMGDPAEWFATAADPYALEKSLALIYNRGAWGGAGITACHDSLIEACGTGFADYVPQIAQAVQIMEAEIAAENCYDEMITTADVEKYVQELVVTFENVDEAAVTSAAVNAFRSASGGSDSANFQLVALQVIMAIHGSLGVTLRCPQEELDYWYGHLNPQCP